MTFSPAAGAAEPRVTVPVEVAPPVKLVGLKVKPVRVGGFTVNDPVTVEVLRVAVTVAVDGLPTAVVVTLNVALVDPAATVTLAGTDAEV